MYDLMIKVMLSHVVFRLLAVEENFSNKTRAVGNDGKAVFSSVELKEFLKCNWNDLEKNTDFTIRRVMIPKGKGRALRPLGISNIDAKCVQRVILYVLEPLSVFTSEEEPNSFGYSKNIGCHNAIAKLYNELNEIKPRMIINLDLTKCFDSVKHESVLELIEKLKLHKLINIIKRFLTCDIIFEGKRLKNLIGFPQGSIISPILCNFILDSVKRVDFGSQKYFKIVRYVDDFVIYGCGETEFWMKYLIEKFKVIGVEINLTKTTIFSVGSNGEIFRFTFLGYQFEYNGVNCNLSIPEDKIFKICDKIKYIFPKLRRVSCNTLLIKLKQIIEGWAIYYQLIGRKVWRKQVEVIDKKVIVMLKR